MSFEEWWEKDGFRLFDWSIITAEGARHEKQRIKKAWQAAQAEQREKDAAIADERAALETEWMTDEYHKGDQDKAYYEVAINAAKVIAAAIRGQE